MEYLKDFPRAYSLSIIRYYLDATVEGRFLLLLYLLLCKPSSFFSRKKHTMGKTHKYALITEVVYSEEAFGSEAYFLGADF